MTQSMPLDVLLIFVSLVSLGMVAFFVGKIASVFLKVALGLVVMAVVFTQLPMKMKEPVCKKGTPWAGYSVTRVLCR